MDFVVVGFGIGALGVLLGVLMRGWLAGRSERAASRAATPAAAAYDLAAAAECRGAGQAFLYAGGVIILATVGGLAGALDDGAGALVVATTATVAALCILVWGYLYRLRNPMPSRPRRQKQSLSPAGTEMARSMLAASASPAAEPVMAAASAEIESEGEHPIDQAPSAGENGEPGDADAAAPTSEEETGSATRPESAFESGSVGTEGAELPLEARDSTAAYRPEAGSAANGRSADDAVIADKAKIVAFVAPGARAGEERASGSDDDGSDGR